MTQSRYDFSEFSPEKDEEKNKKSKKYDFSEFSSSPENRPATQNTDEKIANARLADLMGLFIPAVKFAPEKYQQKAAGAVKTLASDIGGVASDIVSGTRKHGVQAVERAFKEPERSAVNIGAGLAEIPRGIANIPHNTPDILQHYGLISPERAAKLPRVPEVPEVESKFNKMMGAEPDLVDKYVRALAGNLPMLIPAAGEAASAGKAAVGAASRAFGSENPVAAAGKIQSELEHGRAAENLEQKRQTYEANKEALGEAKENAAVDVGTRDTASMQRYVNQKQEAVQNKSNEVENLKDQLSQTQPGTGEFKDLNSELERAEQEHAALDEEHKAAKEAHEALKNHAIVETGRAGVPQMERAAGQAEAGINQATQQANELERQLTEVKPVEGDLPMAEATLGAAEEQHGNAQNRVNEAENQVSNHLAEREVPHDVELGRRLEPALSQIKERGSHIYDEVERRVEEKNVHLTNSEDLHNSLNELDALIRAGRSHTQEALDLHNLIEDIRADRNIPASEYISALKATNGQMRDAYRKAYEVGASEDSRMENRARAAELRNLSDRMSRILENSIGSEDYQLLQDATNYWRTNVAPLYSEPLYWKILDRNKSNLPKDIPDALRGAKPGSGAEIIKNLIKSDPEALRNAVAQRYKGKIENLSNPSSLTREYMNHAPEVRQMVENHKNAVETAEKTKENLEKAKLHHGEISKRHEASKKMQSNLEDLHSKIEKDKKELSKLDSNISSLKKSAKDTNISLKKKMEMQSKIKSLNEEHSKLKERQAKAEDIEKKITRFTDEINKLNSEIPELKHHIETVKKVTKQTNLSLKEMNQAKKEFSRATKELAKKNDQLFETTTGLKKAWLISKNIYKIVKKFT